MTETILILNAGSSSIKFQLFAVEADDKLIRRMKGQIDGIGTRPRLFAKAKEGETLVDQSWPASAVADAAAALDKAVTWLQQQLGGELPSAIGHRVAHGGPDFGEPTVIDDAVLEQLEHLCRWPPSISRTISPPYGRSACAARNCSRSPASTPPFIAAMLKLRSAMPFLTRSIARASVDTDFTACPMSTSRRRCRGSRRPSQRPRRRRASRQRRLHVRHRIGPQRR